MNRSTIVRTSAIGAACACAGAAAGIAGTSASSSSAARKPAVPGHGRVGILRQYGLLPPGAGPAVHVDAVVPNGSGGFETITRDRGSFTAASGDQLTITEGTRTATYKTVTFTIPAGAPIRRNGEAAQLSSLKSGDKVIVLQSPGRTVVIAHDAHHRGLAGGRRLGHRFGPGGPETGLPGGPMPPPAGIAH